MAPVATIDVVAAGAQLEQRREDAKYRFGLGRAVARAAHRVGGGERPSTAPARSARSASSAAGASAGTRRWRGRTRTRPRATVSASLTQRRIIAAARTPCERRERLTCSIICLRPLVEPADQLGDRALQPDLARGHRAGAELVLQAHDPVGVARAVLQPARQREQREPARAGRARLPAGRASARHRRRCASRTISRRAAARRRPRSRATVSIAPTSEPPAFSVMNCVPFHNVERSADSMRGRGSPCSSWLAKRRIRWIDVSVTLIGHISPNSPCTNRYWKAYFATGGSGRSMPSTPPRWLMAWNWKSPKAIRSISR